MLSLLFSRVGGVILGAVAVMAFAVFAIHTAYQAGRDAERTAALTKSVEVLRERNAIDGKTRNMDSGSLCRALGGEWVPDDGTCK